MNYKDVNDYELIYRVRENNDEFAMNDLVLKYEPIIAKTAKKYYSTEYKGVEIGDFVQEGRIAVIRALQTYDYNNESLFYTYALVCINRRMISFCRKLCASKQSILNNSVSEECLLILGDLRYEPVSYLYSLSFDNFVKKVIYSLDGVDSYIFELRYNGFSYKEISDLLDMSLSSVSRHICKIRRGLQVIKDKF